MRTSLLKTPEHRSRELLNLVVWAERCAQLPHAGEVERGRWQDEVRRAWDELRSLELRPESARFPGTSDAG